MKVIFSTDGDGIDGVDYGSKFHEIVNSTFDNLEIDMPQCPVEGQSIHLAKDGIVLKGEVDYVSISYYAPNNGIFIEQLDGTIEYFVRLKNMEVLDWDDERYDKSLLTESRFPIDKKE